MKARVMLLLAPFVLLGVAVALLYLRPKPQAPPLTRDENNLRAIPRPPPAALVEPPTLPPAIITPLRLPPPPREPLAIVKPEFPIQDHTTIDFSIGAPVVRSDGDDQAALARALKEMAEATKDTTFPPRPAATSGSATPGK